MSLKIDLINFVFSFQALCKAVQYDDVCETMQLVFSGADVRIQGALHGAWHCRDGGHSRGIWHCRRKTLLGRGECDVRGTLCEDVHRTIIIAKLCNNYSDK